MPDYPDGFGTPLVHGVSFPAGQVSPLVVAAGGSQTFSLLVSHPGYFIDIFATINAAATIPFYLVEFKWQDSAGTTTIDIEHFGLAASSAGPWRTCGKGPNRGQLLVVTITNFDPARSITVTYSIGETTQHIARDDWRTVDYQTASVPTFGALGALPTGIARGDCAAGILITETNDTIPATTSWAILLPLYCGFVDWQFLANANIAVSVRIPPTLPAASLLDQNAPIWIDLTLTDVTVQLAHPRWPLVVNLQNTTGAPISGVNATAFLVENAS